MGLRSRSCGLLVAAAVVSCSALHGHPDLPSAQQPASPRQQGVLAGSKPHSRPCLLAVSRRDEEARAQDLAAAGWVAGLALASEVVQYVNTAAVVFAFQRTTGCASPPEMALSLPVPTRLSS